MKYIDSTKTEIYQTRRKLDYVVKGVLDKTNKLLKKHTVFL